MTKRAESDRRGRSGSFRALRIIKNWAGVCATATRMY